MTESGFVSLGSPVSVSLSFRLLFSGQFPISLSSCLFFLSTILFLIFRAIMFQSFWGFRVFVLFSFFGGGLETGFLCVAL